MLQHTRIRKFKLKPTPWSKKHHMYRRKLVSFKVWRFKERYTLHKSRVRRLRYVKQ